MGLSTADILGLPDSPQKRAMLAQLRVGSPKPFTEVTASYVRVTIDTPKGVRAVNPLNTRKHWRVDQKRAKSQLNATVEMLATIRLPPLPVKVRMVRLAPCLMDDDGCSAALKHFRDGVAKVYGVDDGDRQAYQWEPDQERSSSWAVRIEIQSVPARPAGGTQP